jgi:hypothetical protein
MKKLIAICLVLMLFGTGYAYGEAPGWHGFLYDRTTKTWTTLDYPGASWTRMEGVSGSNVAGFYFDANGNRHGFLYNGTTWTTIDYPGETTRTEIWGIDGRNLVGVYGSIGYDFLYNGTTWTTIDYPGAISTGIFDIDGSNLVGGYKDNSGKRSKSALYYDANWTTIDFPESRESEAYGIDGSNVVGGYRDSGDVGHIYLYNIDTNSLNLLNFPGAMWTESHGAIDGDIIAGNYSFDGGSGFQYYYDWHGFLYNINDANSWTTFDFPGADKTLINGMDSGGIVGEYYIAPPVPEPATFVLLGLGGLMLVRRRRQRALKV